MNNTWFQQQFEHCKEAVLLHQADGIITYANPAAGDLFGFDRPEELCGKTAVDLSPQTQPDGTPTRVLLERCLQNAAETGTCRFEWTVRHPPSGRYFPCEIRLTTMNLQDPPLVYSVVRDMTEQEAAAENLRRNTRDLSAANEELRASRKAALKLMQDFDLQRKRAEDALQKVKESETYTQLLFDRFPMGLAECRTDGRLVSTNPRLLQILGTDRNVPAEGMSFWELFPDTDEKEEQRASLRKNGHYGPFDTVCLCADGRRVPIRLQGLMLERKGEQFIWSTVEDVTEERRITEELHAAREKAEASSRSKSEFVANVSHEIRTPLNAIIGMNHLLSRSGLTAEQHGYLRKQRVATSTLLSVVNEVLDFSKMESGGFAISPHPFELEALFEDLAVVTAHVAQNKGLEYLFDLGPELSGQVIGDRNRIRQILLNLCNNAIKFTHSGSVVVRGRLKPGAEGGYTLFLQVQDTGIGISAEELERIFDSFHQADPTSTRSHGGTGLGLAICRKLAHYMMGSLTVDSTPGEGSTFTCELPVQMPGPTETVAPPRTDLTGLRVLLIEDHAPSRQLITAMLEGAGCEVEAPDLEEHGWGAVDTYLSHHPCDLLLCDIFLSETDAFALTDHIARLPAGHQPKTVILMSGCAVEDIHKLAGRRPLGPILSKPFTARELIVKIREAKEPGGAVETMPYAISRNRLPGVRILLVEDNELNREVAAGLLKAEGVMVDSVNSGREALQAVQASPYDLILMDLQMPEMDGVETTRRIRKLKGMEHIPIIALTATTGLEVGGKILRAGLNDYLPKPLDPEVLISSMISWLPSAPPSPGNSSPPLPRGGSRLPLVDGLEAEKGLRHFGGNLEFYLRMLRRFCEEHSDEPTQILDAWQEGGHGDAARRVHTLKGLLLNLGFRPLARTARQIERAMEKDRPGEVESELEHLRMELGRVLDLLKKTIDQESAFTEDSAPVAISLQETRDLLHQLQGKLEQAEARALEDWETLLRPVLCQTGLTRYLPELDRAMQTYDFPEALKTLRLLEENLNRNQGEQHD